MANKQAIIMIHGMGEQIPMDTLNSFVDAVWTKDRSLINEGNPNRTGAPLDENRSWAKPDETSEHYDLRRVATESSKGGQRVDFFEFYWAHHMEGTTPGQLVSWVASLLFRNPCKRVPNNVFSAWLILWILTALIAIGLAYPVIGPHVEKCLGFTIPAWLRFGLTAFGAAAWFVISRFLIKSFGDVARYVKAKPYNVHVRETIRKEGVKLLEKIMDKKKDDKYEYDSVTVVSHSLGTIVAYDILTHAFAERNTRYEPVETIKPEDKRAELEAMVRDKNKPWDLDTFRNLQDEAREELNKNGMRWPLRDFVTLGSPLTHAEFLLARDKKALEKNKTKRLFPACPPTLEYDESTERTHFTYRYGGITQSYIDQETKDDAKATDEEKEALKDKKQALAKASDTPRTPHHAALFAYTRWTNIYSPPKFILFGDMISGELSGNFGLKRGEDDHISGIKDIPVMPEVGKKHHPFLAHVKYWNLETLKDKKDKDSVPYHIQQLRKTLRIDPVKSGKT